MAGRARRVSHRPTCEWSENTTTHLRPPSSIPTTQQINTPGEEPGLEEPQYDPQPDETLPILDEPDGQGGYPPEDGDGREEVTGSYSTEEEVGGEFEDDVCAERGGVGQWQRVRRDAGTYKG